MPQIPSGTRDETETLGARWRGVVGSDATDGSAAFCSAGGGGRGQVAAEAGEAGLAVAVRLRVRGGQCRAVAV